MISLPGCSTVAALMERGIGREQAEREVEELVYGANCAVDPVSGRPFETGIGSLPKEIQAKRFAREMEGDQ